LQRLLVATILFLVLSPHFAQADNDTLLEQFERAQALKRSTGELNPVIAKLISGEERARDSEIRSVLPELDRLRRTNPSNPILVFALGNAQRILGRRAESDSLFALSIGRAGSDSGALLALAYMFEQLRLFEQEEAAYSALLDVSVGSGYTSRPTLGYYFFRRGLERQSGGEGLQAVAEFEKATQFDPYLLPAHLMAIGLNAKLFKGKAASQTMSLERAVASSFFVQQLFCINSFRAVVVCLVILTVVFLLGISFKNLPYIQHQVYEILPSRVPGAYRSTFAWILLMLPLIWLWSMFPLLVIPVYLLAVWIAAVPKEKIIIFVCFLFMAAIPQLADMEAKLLRPLDPNDRVNVLAKAQLRGHESTLITKLESFSKRDPSDFETMFSLGLLKHRGGMFDEAMSIFTVASDLKPRSAAVRNNLGNTYFVLGEYDKALEEYELAARLEPDAPAPHYNLAQTFSEKLMFSESSDELNEALRLDFTRVNRFRRASGKNQPVEVMDMTISPSRLWEIVFRSSPRNRESPLMSGLFGVDARLLSYVSSSLLFLAIILGIALRKAALDTECTICGAQSCYRCVDNEMCPRCSKKIVMTESSGMRERLEQKLRARAIKYRKIKALVLSIVSPGAGHVFIGSTWKGVGFSLMFSLLLMATFLKGLLMRMSPFVQTRAGLTYTVVAAGLVLVVYLFCARSVMRTLGLEEG